jgi:hypothetical protein
MKFNITALIDDDTKKSLREVLVGQVKALTRELLNDTIMAEIRTKLDLAAEHASSSWHWQRHINDALTEVLRKTVESRWSEIGSVIGRGAESAVNKAVADKLANKVVWEAAQQKDFMREIAKEEIREALKGLFGGIK